MVESSRNLAKTAAVTLVSSKKLYDIASYARKTGSTDLLLMYIQEEVVQGKISPDFGNLLKNHILKLKDMNKIREVMAHVCKLRDYFYIEPLMTNLDSVKQISGASNVFRFDVSAYGDAVTITIFVDKYNEGAWRSIYEKFYKGQKTRIVLKRGS